MCITKMSWYSVPASIPPPIAALQPRGRSEYHSLTTPVLSPKVIQVDRSAMQLFKVHARGQMCADIVSMVSKLLLTELTVKISSKGPPAGSWILRPNNNPANGFDRSLRL